MSATLDFRDAGEWTADMLATFLEQDRSFDLDWRRFEIVDGALVVSPQASGLHSYLADELTARLRAVSSADLHVSGAIGIDVGRSYLVTDVTVLKQAAFRRARTTFEPSDVLLAVEIESPSSITTDRITKPAQYAAAGIAFYWRVETDPLRLVTYRLVDGGYVESGAWSAGEAAWIIDPFAVEIDVASLLP